MIVFKLFPTCQTFAFCCNFFDSNYYKCKYVGSSFYLLFSKLFFIWPGLNSLIILVLWTLPNLSGLECKNRGRRAFHFSSRISISGIVVVAWRKYAYKRLPKLKVEASSTDCNITRCILTSYPTSMYTLKLLFQFNFKFQTAEVFEKSSSTAFGKVSCPQRTRRLSIESNASTVAWAENKVKIKLIWFYSKWDLYLALHYKYYFERLFF